MKHDIPDVITLEYFFENKCSLILFTAGSLVDKCKNAASYNQLSQNDLLVQNDNDIPKGIIKKAITRLEIPRCYVYSTQHHKFFFNLSTNLHDHISSERIDQLSFLPYESTTSTGK